MMRELATRARFEDNLAPSSEVTMRASPARMRKQPTRFSPSRIWALCAMPWLALVVGLSIYDHQRAIGLMARAQAPETTVEFMLHWLIAAATYTAEAIAFCGLLPLGITFFLYVLFLPWAIPWAQGGDYED